MSNSDFEQVPKAALTALEEKLKLAQQDSGRGAAITALQGIIDFINAIPRFEARNLAYVFAGLLSALNDLDDGVVVSMLRQTPVRHRKREPSQRKVLRACAIFAVEELQKKGMPVEEACRFVARHLEQARVPIGGRAATPPWKTVLGWRNDTTRREENDQERNLLEALRTDRRFPKAMSLDELKKELGVDLAQVFSPPQRALE